MKCSECGKSINKVNDCREYLNWFRNYVPEIKAENLLICDQCLLWIIREIGKLAKNYRY